MQKSQKKNSKKSSDISNLKRISKEFFNKNKECLADIILFGSFLKADEGYHDIDLSIITKCNKETSIDLATDFEKLFGDKVHVTYHIIDDFFSKDEPIWASMLHEGYSLVFDKKVASFLTAKFMFTYKSNTLSYTDQIRFYYSLKGRDGKSGILKETDSEFLGKGIILTDVSNEKEFVSFFMNWKMPFKKKRMFIA